MEKPTLVVLAAGMGSRYGSLKQIDAVGPAGEAIIDYSVYDAARAGFGKVVFVIRHALEREFREMFSPNRFGGAVDVDYAYQELDRLPEGCRVPEGRVKPWGTNHAVLCAADRVNGPFAVINADDFYGREAYETIAGFLRSASGRGDYCMVGYRLENTLSDFGFVSRGECRTDADGYLVSLTERTAVTRTPNGIEYDDGHGNMTPIAPDTAVSMNLFGFTPDYFDYSEEGFREFLAESGSELKSEFYIPWMVNRLMSSGRARMKVLSSPARWFGVTYKEDKPEVMRRLRELAAEGTYPERLWK